MIGCTQTLAKIHLFSLFLSLNIIGVPKLVIHFYNAASQDSLFWQEREYFSFSI